MANWNRRTWSEDQDAAIRAAYLAKVRGANKALAYRFGVSIRAISARAAVLGLPPLIGSRHAPGAAWREDEIALVRANLNESVSVIRARLAKKLARYRSESAIRTLISRRRTNGEWPSFEDELLDRNRLLLPAVCAGLGVGEWIVRRWIQKGYLRARQPRDDSKWAIHLKDLKAFLIQYPSLWDHRTVDRWFLIDVLLYPRTPGKRENVQSNPMQQEESNYLLHDEYEEEEYAD